MVPEEWRQLQLGDVVTEFRGGGTPSRKQAAFWGGDIPWASVKDLVGERLTKTGESITQEGLSNSSASRIPAGTVILATRMAVGKVVTAEVPLAINQDLKGLLPATGLSSSYLKAWLNWRKTDIAALASGTTVKGIRLESLRRLPIVLPPLPEQQKIAAILSSVDDAITATRKIIEQTKRVKQGLLQTLMTRGIGHTRFKKTEIGEIPESWEVVRLDALGRQGIQTVRSGPFGSSLKGEHFTNSGRPVLTIQSLGEGRIEDEGLFFVGPEKARELEDYEVRRGDLVFSRVADIGRSVVIGERADGWIISSNLIRLSPDKDKVDPWYLMYCIVGGGAVTRQIERLAGAHGRPVVSSTMLKGLRFPVPPKEEQEEIASRIAGMENYVAGCEDGLERLDQVKRGLMQDLLTGRVRVPLD